MTLAALDLNANRVWAVQAPAGQAPRTVHLDGDRPELPLALMADKKSVVVGRAGLYSCRKTPHLVCQDFLAQLGTEWRWRAGRVELDAAAALGLIFARVRPALDGAQGIVVAVPSYLSRSQGGLLAQAAQDAGLPLLGLMGRDLAAGLASYAEHAWHNVGIVVDIDDHALTCTLLRPNDAELCALGHRVLTSLGLRVWKERLLACIADHCVRICRRDPRASAEADQTLYEQLDHILDQCSQNQAVPVRALGVGWFQEFTLTPAEALAACAPLAGQVAEEIRAALAWAEGQMTSATVYFTSGAARLPGLAAAVYQRCENRAPIAVLQPDAAARAAHALAVRIDQGELAPGLFMPTAPLPVSDKPEAPPVLRFPTGLSQAANEYS